MLNISCVICTELLSHTDQVYATKCGHIFHNDCIRPWLISSNSCPQCRETCTEDNIYRLYFNLAEVSDAVDIDSLKEKLENASLMAEVHKIDLNLAEEHVKKLNAAQIKFKKISELEQKIKKNDSLILSYNTKLESAQKLTNEADSLRNEVKNLKEQITKFKNVSSILTSTAKDAEKLLKDESNPTTLTVWVSALKKECQTHERKITEYENVILLLKADLRRATALNKEREKRLSQLESENCILTEKVDQDKSKVQTAEKDLQVAKKQLKNLEEKLRNCQKKYSDVHGHSRESATQISSLCLEKSQIKEQFESSEARRAQLEIHFKNTQDRLERECHLKEGCIATLNLEKSQIKTQLESLEAKRAQLETNLKSTLDRLERECVLKEECIASLNLEKSQIKKQLESSEIKRAKLETNLKSTLDRLERERILKEECMACIKSLKLEKADIVKRCKKECNLKADRALLNSIKSQMTAEFETERKHLGAALNEMQNRLNVDSYIKEHQAIEIITLYSEISGLTQRLKSFQNEKKSGFRIGKFSLIMIVLGGSMAFCLYRDSLLEEINALNRKLIFSRSL